jgi:hypothetical protein
MNEFVDGIVTVVEEGDKHSYDDRCVIPTNDTEGGYYIKYDNIYYKEVVSCPDYEDCYVAEFYCDGDTVEEIVIACDYGCVVGICGRP